MVEARRITDPSLLFDITKGLASLGIEANPSDSAPQIQEATFALLQPLANANMLAACRDADSRLVRKSDGTICATSNHEYLNIRPLSKAWRRAVTKVQPISHITFDLTLPKADGGEKSTNDGFQEVYWDTAMPQEGGIAVHTQDVMTLAITLATGTRMRAQGPLRFGVTYNETEGVTLRAMTLLKKQLLALEPEYNSHVKDGESDQNNGE